MDRPVQPYHLVWLEKHPNRTEEWLRERLADGFHIHHVDGDHGNNCADNLVLIDGVDHLSVCHGMKLGRVQRVGIARRRPRKPAHYAKGQEYYYRRRSGEPWSAMGGRPAMLAAKRYAGWDGKPWPVFQSQ